MEVLFFLIAIVFVIVRAIDKQKKTQEAQRRAAQESQRKALEPHRRPAGQPPDARFPDLPPQAQVVRADVAEQARRAAELARHRVAQAKLQELQQQRGAPRGLEHSEGPTSPIKVSIAPSSLSSHTLEASSISGHTHVESSMEGDGEPCPPVIRYAKNNTAAVNEIPAAPQPSFRSIAHNRSALKQALIYNEILGKPKALKR